MANSSCNGCMERRVGCHSACKKYAEFRMQVAEEREAERRAKQLDRLGESLSAKGTRRR